MCTLSSTLANCITMLGLAIAITAQAFQGKKDKGGQPYILHCLRVMDGVKHMGHDAMCAAVMHDLLEDTDWTMRDLLDAGFTPEIVGNVSILTKTGKLSYDDYIKRIALHTVPRAIKMVDIRDNADVTRLKGLTKKDFDRMEKYHRSYEYLKKV